MRYTGFALSTVPILRIGAPFSAPSDSLQKSRTTRFSSRWLLQIVIAIAIRRALRLARRPVIRTLTDNREFVDVGNATRRWTAHLVRGLRTE
jgi:hypothetical protein